MTVQKQFQARMGVSQYIVLASFLDYCCCKQFTRLHYCRTAVGNIKHCTFEDYKYIKGVNTTHATPPNTLLSQV